MAFCFSLMDYNNNYYYCYCYYNTFTNHLFVEYDCLQVFDTESLYENMKVHNAPPDTSLYVADEIAQADCSEVPESLR